MLRNILDRSTKSYLTLSELIVLMVKRREIDSPEWKQLEGWYGREKMRELYKAALQPADPAMLKDTSRT